MPLFFVAYCRYITTTHDLTSDTGWSMTDYNCLSTDDLVNWRDEGIVFSMKTVQWAKLAWAQQVVPLPNGTYLMAFPGMGGSFNWTYPGGVGLASSSSPSGPFNDAVGAPLMPGDDPTLFVDKATGEVHLCSNLNGPNCGVLDPAHGLKQWKVPPPNLTTWPRGSQTILGSSPPFTKEGWHWYEAPWIYQIDDVYYMSFMMNQNCPGSAANISGGVACPTGACATLNCSWAHYGSDLGYAMSTASPVANYTARGSFMWSPPYNCGLSALANESASLCNSTGGDNNHHGMVEFPKGSGRHYLAYHTRKLAADRGEYQGYQRNIAMDRLYVNSTDKSLLPVTATPRWLKPARYLNPYVQTPAFTIAYASAGVATKASTDAETTAGAKQLAIFGPAGSYTMNRHVDFGKSPGATSVQLRVATAGNGTSIEIFSSLTDSHMGGSSSPPSFRTSSARIAACKLPNTGGLNVWETVVCPILPLAGNVAPAAGTKSYLHFLFQCPSCAQNAPAVVGFNFWRFNGGRASNAVPPKTQVPVQLRSRGAAGLYLAADGPGGAIRASSRTSKDSSTHFRLVDNEDGSWGIQTAEQQLLYVQKSTGELLPSPQHMPSSDDNGKFRLQPTVDGSWAVQSYATRLWLEVTGSAANFLVTATAEDPRGLLADGGRFDLVEMAA